MAGFVPNEYRVLLLEGLVGRTAISTATVYLGLALSLPTDPSTATLATISEVTTSGYARKAIPAFPAATLGPPVQMVHTTAFAFNVLTADMTTPAYFAFMTAASSGTAAPIRYIWELPGGVQGRTGEPINIPANMLVIE